MVGSATFRHGDPIFEDYPNAPAAINAGDVIVTNFGPRVAHHDFAQGDLASLAAVGGVYEMYADIAIGNDTRVYWDPVNKWVTATAGALKSFGVTASATTGPGQTLYVRHQPGV